MLNSYNTLNVFKFVAHLKFIQTHAYTRKVPRSKHACNYWSILRFVLEFQYELASQNKYPDKICNILIVSCQIEILFTVKGAVQWCNLIKSWSPHGRSPRVQREAARCVHEREREYALTRAETVTRLPTNTPKFAQLCLLRSRYARVGGVGETPSRSIINLGGMHACLFLLSVTSHSTVGPMHLLVWLLIGAEAHLLLGPRPIALRSQLYDLLISALLSTDSSVHN